jgi:hypothetical protein
MTAQEDETKIVGYKVLTAVVTKSLGYKAV